MNGGTPLPTGRSVQLVPWFTLTLLNAEQRIQKHEFLSMGLLETWLLEPRSELRALHVVKECHLFFLLERMTGQGGKFDRKLKLLTCREVSADPRRSCGCDPLRKGLEFL